MKNGLIILTIVTLMLSFSIVAFAGEITPQGTPSIGAFNPGDYIPSVDGNGKVLGIGSKIIGIFQIIGSIVAVASLIFMGIKLMLASPGERANVKAHTVPYIVGAVMLFSIVNLLAIVSQIMSNLSAT
ncbi:MAG: hypothetical protein PHH22_02465 [Clostridia bacterium]|nr:hypothetical protein [Clostridia bacterium]